MRLWWSFLAVAVLGSSATAQGMSYGWCETKGRDGNYLMSALMQKAEGQSVEPYEAAFLTGVGSGGRPSCWFFYASPREAKSHFEQRQYVIETQEKARYQLTGWTGPYGITGEHPAGHSGAFLTVEKGRPAPAEAAAEQAKRDLEALRADAARMVRIAAIKARQDADYQAAMTKFFAEMRKRGNKQ